MLEPQHTKMRLLAVCCLLLLVSASCSPADSVARGRALGHVTLDGQPIAEGTIVFLPVGNTHGPTSGGAIENGKYDIAKARGPVVGTNLVQIHAMKKTGRQVSTPYSGLVDELVELIPPRFNTDSTLRASIETKDNELNFELVSVNQDNTRK